jgi:hypothetical protein
MFDSTGDLEAIERYLRMALKQFEQEARVRGDYIETVFCVHSALEDAFDVHLRWKGEYSAPGALDQLRFSDKAQGVIPEVCGLFDIERLEQQFNSYAHPGRVFYEQVTDKEIKDTAIEFIQLGLESWTRLFGGPPPSVSEPPPLPAPEDIQNLPAVVELKQQLVDVLDERDTLADELEKRDAQIQELQKRPPEPPVQSSSSPAKRKFSWRALVLGLILLLPMPFIAGMGEYIWRVKPAAWYGLLIPAALLLVLSFFALRSLWRFIRSVGVVRAGAILSIALVVATLAFMPFAGLDLGWVERPGAALTRVLGLVDSSIGRYVSMTFSTGAMLPGRFLSATPGGPAGSPATTKPTRVATVTVGPQRAATAKAQTPMPAGAIAIGARVTVKTDGTALLSRAAAGKDKDVVARFDNNSELVVVDGPVVTDGITWWKVEGKGGSGWSAADYIVPK